MTPSDYVLVPPAVQHIKDFLKAVDSGYLGQMPDGFNASAFVVALRSAAAAPTPPSPQPVVDVEEAFAIQGWCQSNPREAANEIIRLRSMSLDEMREVLACFLEDERFDVAIGGNPVAVAELVKQARALLSKLKEMGTPDTSPSVKQE